MPNIKFIKIPVADGRNIVINYAQVEAIEDKGETIKIMFSGKWLEVNMTLEEFVDKCNARDEDNKA